MELLKRLLKDLTSDEYNDGFDVVNFEATLSFFLGIAMFLVNQFHPVWAPKFDLLSYAAGISALLTATAAAQRLKPPAQPPAKQE